VWFNAGGFGTDGVTIDVDSLSHTSAYNPVTTSVPEPCTLALLGIGLLAIGFVRRRTV